MFQINRDALELSLLFLCVISLHIGLKSFKPILSFKVVLVELVRDD